MARGFSGFVSLTGPLAPRVVDCRSAAMLIKSALRDLAFCIIWHSKHYGNQPPPVAFSPFGALRHYLPAPLGSVSHDSQVALLPYESCSLATAERWDNKDPQGNPFISYTTISTGCSATACGGSPAKRARGKPLHEQSEAGLFSDARRAVVWFYTNWRLL